mgnify:CR=1 FL=1
MYVHNTNTHAYIDTYIQVEIYIFVSFSWFCEQSFAADLLDMADNLHRTAATVPESFQDRTSDSDTSSNAKLLKSLLEGVIMTEKQLLKVFMDCWFK